MENKTCNECRYNNNETCHNPAFFGHSVEKDQGCLEWEAGAVALTAAEKQAMEIIPRALEEIGAMVAAMKATNERMAAMAEMVRITNERMAALEAAVRTLEKVTPQQAARINKAIRERAASVCEDYRMGEWRTPEKPEEGQGDGERRFEPDRDAAKKITAAIRGAVKEMTGARTMREVARCDYDSVIELAMDWEDYETIQGIRKKVRE